MGKYMQQSVYDIVIIGGGMVGATLALALRQKLPLDVTLAVVEAHELSTPDSLEWQPSYDARSTALSAGARKIFQKLGIWDSLSENVEPILDIHVSDRGHFGMTRLHAREHNVPALGYVVENSWLGHVLVKQVLATEGVDWLCPMQIQRVEPEPDGMILETDRKNSRKESGHESIRAGLVILADGGRSNLARDLGLETSDRDYQQGAIVANITPSKHHGNTAYERFTDQGPMALLPRSDGVCALVWAMPAELAEERMQLVDDDFLTELQDRFGYRLGRFQRVGERYSYPLMLKQACEQVRSRLVILGNAAHSLHPVAGQGFNLSLRDVQVLADVVGKAYESGRNPGDLEVLRSYVDIRGRDQRQTIGFSDQVVRLFSNQSLPLTGARNLGLLGMELIFPAKDWFARQAMGIGC